jgi:hypothetical protein
MVNKFKNPYFDALMGLYKQFEGGSQRSHIALGILRTFTFLLQIDASEEVVRTYRSHIIMSSS